MQSELHTILKPDVIKKFRGQPSPEILASPLHHLSFLSDNQIARLRDHKIATVADLTTLKDLSRLGEFQIDPGLIQRLICFLLYPQHDPGPDCAWERLFQSAPLDYYIHYPQTPFHTRFGPVFYRGRLDGSARVLMIGQDPATDETLGHRAFVGRAGQIAQHFLGKLGLTRSYLMFNTFLYGVQSGSITASMTTDATITAYRNKLFDHAKATSSLTAILAFGSHAYSSAMSWPGRGSLPVIHLTHPTAPSGVASNWNSHLNAASATIAPDSDGHVDLSPYDTTAALPSTDVPRRDLPFGVPAWHGAGGGTRSHRGSGATFETEITWTAP